MGDHVATTCPAPAILLQWVKGTLPADDVDWVDKHVASCERCVGFLDESEYSEGPFVDYLRGYDESLCEEAGYCHLRREIEEQVSDVPSSVATPAPRSAGDEGLAAATVLGNYRLAEQIGRGAMGTVYRAQHAKLKRWVAVKVLSPRRQESTAAIKQFEQEMEILGQLEEHEHIVRARDAGQHGAQHFLVMDYVDGIDVGQLVRNAGPLEVADACEIVRQAALALAHAHQHGLIHRDVKPSNLMVTREGSVKLLDLGLASYRDAPSEETGIVGTADYMAPEQWQAGAIGTGADVYGLGCTLFKLLVGYAPFSRSAATNEAKRQSHCSAPPVSVESIRRDVPPHLGRLIADMLAKNPLERTASAAEVARAIAPMALGENLPAIVANALTVETETDRPGGELTHPELVAHAAKRRRVTRRVWAGAAAAAAAAAWLGWRARQPDYQLLMAAMPDEVKWEYHALRGYLQVHATSLALFTTPTLDSGYQTLDFHVKPLSPQTIAGFFFAYRVRSVEGWTIEDFLALGCSSSEDAAGREVALVRHRFSRAPSGHVAQIDEPLVVESVDPIAGSPMGGRLRIAVRNGTLVAASWNGRQLSKIVEAAASGPTSDLSPSTAGLYVTAGAATFREI